MGHAEPGETLRSYLHLLDWMLGCQLRRDPVILSSDEQAGVLGLTPGSLKTTRHRLGLIGDTSALALLQVLLPSWHEKLVDPVLKEAGEYHPLDAVPVEPKEPIPPPDPWQLYAVLQRHSQGESERDIAARYGYAPDEILDWIQRAGSFAALTTPKGRPRHLRPDQADRTVAPSSERKPALPGLCPAPPHLRNEIAVAKRLAKDLHQLAEANLDLLRDGLGLYLHHANTSQSWLQFPDIAATRRFIEFLRAIGVPKTAVHVLHFPAAAGWSDEKQRRFWSRELHLPIDQITTRERRLGRLQGPSEGKCGIFLVFGQPVENAKGAKSGARRVDSDNSAAVLSERGRDRNQAKEAIESHNRDDEEGAGAIESPEAASRSSAHSGESRHDASHGYRFVLYMSAVVWGREADRARPADSE